MAGYRIYQVQKADGQWDTLTVADNIPVEDALAKQFPGGKLLSIVPVYEATYNASTGGFWSGD